MAEELRLTAMQDVTQREHNESNSGENKHNLVAKSGPTLEK
jgi:hypothetical protein